MIRGSKPRQGGVSLVELVIVLAIVAMLVAIAYPFYGQYKIRADRSDATGSLLEAWMVLERCFVEEMDYRGCEQQIPEMSEQGLYELEVDAGVSRFTLEAIPAPGSPQEADEACVRFTLDHRGERGSEPEPPERCWGE